MNYKKHYDTLILRSINRNITEYTEKHHILPRCLGGTDDEANIVRLTPEEHFIAHQLLVKIYNTPELIYAATMMTVASNNQTRNNKLYGWLRRKLQSVAKQRTGPNNGSYGKPWFYCPETLKNGKFVPGTEPFGWIKGRSPKLLNKCKSCNNDTNTHLQKWCDNCRPKKQQTVFRNDKIKGEYSDADKIEALIKNEGNIRKSLLSLGLNDSGPHYKVMNKLKASLAQWN